MGLVIINRSRLRRNWDILKLKLALDNFATRHLAHELVRAGQGAPEGLTGVLDSYLERGQTPRGGRALRIVLSRLVPLLCEAVAVEPERVHEALTLPSVRRTITNCILTLDKYGLAFPQRFYAPLMVVWNFTYRCNLRCQHCYQNAGALRDRGLNADELPLERKLEIVDELAESHIPTLSFSGGEPLLHPDFWPVAERARERGLYMSLNTNGTLITEAVARRLEQLGIAYAGISLDAPTPELHDRFRGVAGAWERTVAGIRRVAATRVDAVLSVTVTRFNYNLLPQMFELARRLGVAKVMAYNFIPTGRARGIVAEDLTPEMREEALQHLYDYAAAGGSVCATAPQLGRVCKERGRPDLIPLAHTGPGRIKHLEVLADLIGGCGVGRCYCALQPDGRITPCVYMPEVTIGHINRQRLLEVWQGSELLETLADRSDLRGHCGRCEHRAVCGGCRARAYAYFGDFKAPDPGCINNREYAAQLQQAHA